VKPLLHLWGLVTFLLLLSCAEEPVTRFMGPQLLANSPVHFGDGPKGVRQSGRLIITNGGDSPLKIEDFKVTPDDGVFQVGISELPLEVSGRRSKEISVLFTPPSIGSFRAELAFDSNHDGDTLSPIVLLGNGVSNQVCLPCSPPPEPECHLDQTSSIAFVPNQGTDCESDNGVCSYNQVETLCAPLLCDLETGLCPGSLPPPPPAVCGDGTLQEGEECDDGNTENGDGCDNNCTTEDGWDCTAPPCEPICGDGIIAGDEECDDGNTESGDGCGNNCTTEDGWDCTNPPCEPICGDGIITGNEACDDGNTTNGDGCSESCSTEIGWDCSAGECEAVCGDGQTLGDEECDDGNTSIETCDYGAAACTVCGTDCTFVAGLTQSCGDGTQQANEACDDGIAQDGGVGNSNTTPDACREDCTLPICGDNVQDSQEQCDDGNTDIEACDYGESDCTVCGSLCTLVPGVTQSCGDGTLQGAEECDDGVAHDGGVGNSNTAPDACRENCTQAYCGDGIQDTNEACDPGSSVDLYCAYGEPSCSVCNENCEQVDGWAQFCGDGMMHENEDCDDGTDPNSGNSDERADACRTTCVEASCGDGWVDSGEQCDDGNNDLGDGCDTACLVEDDWDCFGSPSVCVPLTPDAPGETCETAAAILASSGSLTGFYGEENNYEPGDLGDGTSCTGYYNNDGPEVLYSITMSSGQNLYVEASSTNNEHDISIYLLDGCPPDGNACVIGTDVYFTGVSTTPESFNYSWSSNTETERTFYLVIDAYCMDSCPTSSDTFELYWDLQ